MNINNNTSPNFNAKFFHSESLKILADYAVEKGKFDKLNKARKSIESSHLRTRLRMDFGESDGMPFVTFTRFTPKKDVIIPQSIDDYQITKTSLFKSTKRGNPIKFAFEQFLKLGNNAPANKRYQSVVVKK